MDSQVTRKSISASGTRRGLRTRLPSDFEPCEYTVLCGRGKEYTSSTGNQNLKTLVLKYLKGYSEAKNKIAKSAIVPEIMNAIKSNCDGAAFVKHENEIWWQVDDAFAREKIGKFPLFFTRIPPLPFKCHLYAKYRILLFVFFIIRVHVS